MYVIRIFDSTSRIRLEHNKLTLSIEKMELINRVGNRKNYRLVALTASIRRCINKKLNILVCNYYLISKGLIFHLDQEWHCQHKTYQKWLSDKENCMNNSKLQWVNISNIIITRESIQKEKDWVHLYIDNNPFKI